jgi:hypothetical protein
MHYDALMEILRCTIIVQLGFSTANDPREALNHANVVIDNPNAAQHQHEKLRLEGNRIRHAIGSPLRKRRKGKRNIQN